MARFSITTQSLDGSIRRTTTFDDGKGPRRLYINRRHPKPESENQDRWALQWGCKTRHGWAFESPVVSTHRTKKLATAAKHKLEEKHGLR